MSKWSNPQAMHLTSHLLSILVLQPRCSTYLSLIVFQAHHLNHPSRIVRQMNRTSTIRCSKTSLRFSSNNNNLSVRLWRLRPRSTPSVWHRYRPQPINCSAHANLHQFAKQSTIRCTILTSRGQPHKSSPSATQPSWLDNGSSHCNAY